MRFDSTPYTLQEDATSHNQHIAAGERVCDCTYLYECHRARGYYRNALEGDQDTSVVVKMAHVVDGDVKMTPIEDLSMLPTTMRRDERVASIGAGVYHLSEDSHSSIIAEMHRRERLDHEEILIEMGDMDEGDQLMRIDEDCNSDED